MDASQLDRIARLLNRISDREERAEITREIAKVLEQAEPQFDPAQFHRLAGTELPGQS